MACREPGASVPTLWHQKVLSPRGVLCQKLLASRNGLPGRGCLGLVLPQRALMGWKGSREKVMLVSWGFRGAFSFTPRFFSSDAEWSASARPAVVSGLAELGLVWSGWGQTSWAGVGLAGVVLGQCWTCWTGCADVNPVVLVAGRRWRSRTVPWAGAARLCQERGPGCFKQTSCAVKTFYCVLSWEGLDYPGSFCCSNSLSSSTKAPQEQPVSC